MLLIDTNILRQISLKLQESFLDRNLECDGAGCIGCWKDVVRESIKMIDSLCEESELSNCCNAIYIPSIADEGTGCFVCSKCEEPKSEKIHSVKTFKDCCNEVAQKNGLGSTLVTGHKASYWTEAAELYASHKNNYPLKLTLESLFQRHATFAEKTFPKSTAESSLKGLEREIDEVRFEKSSARKRIEYIDCLFYLLDSYRRAGFELQDLPMDIEYKLIINEHRDWSKNPDDSYSHK